MTGSGPVPRSLFFLLLVIVQCAAQILVFFAGDRRAQLLQLGQMLFGFADVAGQQVGLADVFMCGAVLWVELERLVVCCKRGVQIARLTLGKPKPVLHVRILWVGSCGFREQLDRALPILGFDRFLALYRVGIGTLGG